MFVSDFANAKSVHQLLGMLFFSEMGLVSVAHPAAQMEGVRTGFTALRKNIVANLKTGAEMFQLSLGGRDDDIVEVSFRADAELFKHLYEGIALFPGIDDATVLGLKVYPLVGRMVLGNTALREKTIGLLQHHAQIHGPAVAARMEKTLSAFGLGILAHSIAPAPQSSGPSVG